jgi:hypothetical protein
MPWCFHAREDSQVRFDPSVYTPNIYAETRSRVITYEFRGRSYRLARKVTFEPLASTSNLDPPEGLKRKIYRLRMSVGVFCVFVGEVEGFYSPSVLDQGPREVGEMEASAWQA